MRMYLGEVVAYIGHSISAEQTPGQWTMGPFIVNSVLALVAPALFAASIYMELGRIVELVDGDSHLFIRRKWLTTTFISGDVLSFLIQGSGMLITLAPWSLKVLTISPRWWSDVQQFTIEPQVGL